MPLSSDSHFGVRPMSEAVNVLPSSSTIIRDLNIFKQVAKTTTYVTVEQREGGLLLVPNTPRGSNGQNLQSKAIATQTFNMLHLPKHEAVHADDVQNLRAFGTDNKSVAVANLVAEKLADMKADIEYTREHLMLGALQGKILDADGSEIVNLYSRFGLTRKSHNIALSNDKTLVNKVLDEIKIAMRTTLKGESAKGFTVLCSPKLYQELVNHKSVYDLYVRMQDTIMTTGQTHEKFTHKGVTFVLYEHEFPNGNKIADGEGIILPNGTRNAFREFFAPANKSQTVNTIAKLYYASRERLDHDKGWDLEVQSNPLPLILRPDLVQTIKMT